MENLCDVCNTLCKVKNKERTIIVISCTKGEFRITKHILDKQQMRLSL